MATSQANPFDAFDEKPVSNPFDAFDEKPAPTPAARVVAPAPPEPGFFSRVGTEFQGIKRRAGELMDSLSGPTPYTRTPEEASAFGKNGPHGLVTYHQDPNSPFKDELPPDARFRGIRTALAPAIGAAEVPLSMATGAAAAGLGGLAGAGRAAYEYASNPDTTLSDSLSKGGETAQSAMGMAYKPRTGFGRMATTALNAPLALASHITGGVGESVGRVLGNEAAGQTIGEAAPALAMSGKALSDLRGAYTSAGARAPLTQAQQAVEAAKANGFLAGPGHASGLINSIVESVGGKEITRKDIIKNQDLANAKARESMRLAPDEHLTREAFDDFRSTAGDAYAAVKSDITPVKMDNTYRTAISDLDQHLRAVQMQFPGLGKNPKIENLRSALLDEKTPKTAEGIMDTIKSLRSDAGTMLRSQDADNVAAGFAYRSAADALEKQLDRHFGGKLSPSKMDDFRQARRDIAASHDLETATNLETGNVDPQVLGRLLARGRPLSGQLREVAQAALTLRNTVRSADRIPQTGSIHAGDAATAGILSYLAHVPRAAAALLARPAAAGIASSRLYERTVGKLQGKPTGGVPLASPAAALSMDAAQNTPWREQQDEPAAP